MILAGFTLSNIDCLFSVNIICTISCNMHVDNCTMMTIVFEFYFLWGPAVIVPRWMGKHRCSFDTQYWYKRSQNGDNKKNDVRRCVASTSCDLIYILVCWRSQDLISFSWTRYKLMDSCKWYHRRQTLQHRAPRKSVHLRLQWRRTPTLRWQRRSQVNNYKQLMNHGKFDIYLLEQAKGIKLTQDVEIDHDYNGDYQVHKMCFQNAVHGMHRNHASSRIFDH